MKRLSILSPMLLLAFAFALEPWQQFGPDGAAVSAMATVPGYPDDIFFVTPGFPARLYYTSNLGTSWTVRETLPDIIFALAVDPTSVSTIYAAGQSGRLFRSVNSGRSWSVRSTITAGQVRQLAVHPANGQEIWAAAEVYGSDTTLRVFRSTDAGSGWDGTVLDSSFSVSARALTLLPATPVKAFVGGSVANQARLFASDQTGANWTDITNGLQGSCVYGVAVSPTSSQTVVCATSAGLFRSTNSGTSWTRQGNFPAFSVTFAPSSPYFGYAGSENLVYRSNDNGATWSADTTAFNGSNTCWIAVNPSGPLEVYAGNGRGVFHSSNGGTSWFEKTSGQRLLAIPALMFRPDAPETAFCTPTGYGMLMSTDHGVQWRTLEWFPGSGLATGVATNPRHPDTLVAITLADSRLHMWTARGDTWISFPMVDRFEPHGIMYHPLGFDTLYSWGSVHDSVAGPGRFALCRSTDKGQTWQRWLVRNGPGSCRGILFATARDTIYAWGSEGVGPVLLRSINRGADWTSIRTGITGTSVRDFSLSPADPQVFYSCTEAGVFRSPDRGANWDDLGLANVTCVLGDTLNTSHIYAGTDTEGVYFTTNSGAVWQRDTISLPGRTARFLTRHPRVRSAVYLGTEGASIMGRGIVGIQEPEPLSGSDRSFAVSPSLVRDRALIRFSRPLSSDAVLGLYAVDGRSTGPVIPIARGTSTRELAIPDVPPGVYIAVLVADSERQVTRIILTR